METCDLGKIINKEVTCSGVKKEVNNFCEDDETIILAEVSILKSHLSETLNICYGHYAVAIENMQKRKRRKVCGVGEVGPLSFHGRGKGADRHVGVRMCRNIMCSIGIFIPVGTPICRLCREKLSLFNGDKEQASIEEAPPEVIPQVDFEPGLKRKCDDQLKDVPSAKRSVQSPQYVFSQESSQVTDSQGSEASIVQVDRLQKLNEFLSVCGISPVKSLQSQYEHSSSRTQRRYTAKANQCITAVLETIFPDEAEKMRDNLFPDSEKNVDESSEKFLQAVAESYLKSESWTVRRQLLSVLTVDFSFKSVQGVIPNLTRYRFFAAKRHMKSHGVCTPIPSEKIQRQKFDESQVEHFIDFITSSNIIKDLPFGEKSLVLSTGEVIKTPNVIRSLAPASIVRQYTQLCTEQNIEHLGESTLYRILTDCSASVRRSLEGLDYYVAEGGQAFKDLEEILKDLDLTTNERQQVSSKLVAAKHYLKTDYKLHISLESSVASHCCSLALSDSSMQHFQRDCSNHEHDQICKDCDSIDEILAHILEKTKEIDCDNQDAILFKAENAVSSILEWRCHILRSKNQESARREITQSLCDGELLVVGDWAMKFLPRKYREGQTDWFAKRGISWHISVIFTKRKHDVEISTYVHVLDGPVSQDATITASILADVIKSSRSISKVNFWTDNAGCYKSTQTFAILNQELGSCLHSFNFCEAQDGKGVCDRKASHLKASIKRYINEGHDVTCAEDMKKAIDSQQHGQYKVKVVSPVVVIDADKPVKAIPSIKQYHNFVFTVTGLTVWRAYQIGAGKHYPWSSIAQGPITITPLRVLVDSFNAGTPEIVSEETDDDDGVEEEIEDANQYSEVKKGRPVFLCPAEGCMRFFKTALSLDKHLTLGCETMPKCISLADCCKVLYSSKLKASDTADHHLQANTCQEDESECPKKKGWALKVQKPKTKFTEDQKSYLNEKFDIGKITGRKEDPQKVAEDMRKEKINGKSRFSKAEYLTTQQISSYFSRLVIKERKLDKDDVRAATTDEKLFLLKSDILKEMSI